MSSNREVRFEADPDDLLVLDGYCTGTGKSKAEVMRTILKTWSEAKVREATLVLRFAKGHGNGPEVERIGNT